MSFSSYCLAFDKMSETHCWLHVKINTTDKESHDNETVIRNTVPTKMKSTHLRTTKLWKVSVIKPCVKRNTEWCVYCLRIGKEYSLRRQTVITIMGYSAFVFFCKWLRISQNKNSVIVIDPLPGLQRPTNSDRKRTLSRCHWSRAPCYG